MTFSTSAAEVLFWTSLLAILTPYLLYPLALYVVHLVIRRQQRARPAHEEGVDARLPSVSFVISAFNEEDVIEEKIRNTLELEFPAALLEVLVISDDSTDRTDEIVERYADRGVRLCRQFPRRGKTAGLSRFVPTARGEVILFSDANAIYHPAAIRQLVRHFRDPHVGYVVGHQRYFDEGQGAAGESEKLYWNYEVAIKEAESAVGSVVGGDGAIYAIRAELFSPLAEDDINDLVNPLQIIAKGYRGVFERDAYCYEHTAASFEGEFRRKTRIVNRSLRGVSRVSVALNPTKVGWFALQLLFHKVLRWFVPYSLVVLLASSAVLFATEASAFYSLLFWGQISFYALAVLVAGIPALRRLRPCYVPYYFCLVNLAAFLGTAGVLCGKRYVVWRPQR